MTTTHVLIVSAWVTMGLIAAVMMGRRGHRHWYWALVALLLGPLAWPILDERTSGETPHVERFSVGQAGPGLHLVVGIDGSAQAAHAAAQAADLLQAAVGQITLATVVDYDADGATHDELDQVARARLSPVSSSLHDCEPAEVVLIGPPVKALLTFASDQAVDMIVVGPRGHGLSQRLMGSVASGVVAGSPVPVLVIGDRPTRR